MDSTVAAQTKVLYEHPLNEHIRVCLRLETLFKTLQTNLHGESISHSREALISLLRIVNVTDRPDLKSKLVKSLSQLATNLGQLEQFPQVDPNRLKSILSQLDHFIQQLHHSRGKLAEPLRHNEFLNQVRLHLTNPAGVSAQALPAYNLWLHQPSVHRISELEQWAAPLDECQKVISLVLNLLRNSTSPKKVTGENGFYQQSQDPNLPCELLRVSLPSDSLLYPEFSAGKHRFNIRFLKPNFEQGLKGSPVTESVGFVLTCCKL